MWLFTLVIDLKLKDLKEFGFRGLWGLLRALGAPIGLWNVSRRVSEKKRGGGNSLMGLSLGSSFKRKGRKKGLYTVFWFVKPAVQGRKGDHNSRLPELCISIRIHCAHPRN